MIVGDDKLVIHHSARNQAAEEATRVDLACITAALTPSTPPPLVGTDAVRGRHGRIARNAASARFLVPSIQLQVPDIADRAAAPRLQFVVEQDRSSADLRRGRRSIPNALATPPAWRVETTFRYISVKRRWSTPCVTFECSSLPLIGSSCGVRSRQGADFKSCRAWSSLSEVVQ